MKNRLLLFCLTLMGSFYSFAQDTTAKVAVTTETNQTTATTVTEKAWYTEPWIWLLGAALLVLILIALLKNKGSDSSTTKKVTVTKTTEVTADNE